MFLAAVSAFCSEDFDLSAWWTKSANCCWRSYGRILIHNWRRSFLVVLGSAVAFKLLAIPVQIEIMQHSFIKNNSERGIDMPDFSVTTNGLSIVPSANWPRTRSSVALISLLYASIVSFTAHRTRASFLRSSIEGRSNSYPAMYEKSTYGFVDPFDLLSFLQRWFESVPKIYSSLMKIECVRMKRLYQNWSGHVWIAVKIFGCEVWYNSSNSNLNKKFQQFHKKFQ